MKGQISQKGIARVLKQLRVDNKLTQQELADILFCDIRQIRRYETEGTDKLTVVNLYAEQFNINSLSILSQAQGAFWLFRTFEVLTLWEFMNYNLVVVKTTLLNVLLYELIGDIIRIWAVINKSFKDK